MIIMITNALVTFGLRRTNRRVEGRAADGKNCEMQIGFQSKRKITVSVRHLHANTHSLSHTHGTHKRASVCVCVYVCLCNGNIEICIYSTR